MSRTNSTLSEADLHIKKILETITISKWKALKIATQYKYALVSEKLTDNPVQNRLRVDIEEVKSAYRRSRRVGSLSDKLNESDNEDGSDNEEDASELRDTVSIIKNWADKSDQIIKENRALRKRSETQEREISRLKSYIDDHDEDLFKAKKRIKSLEEAQEQIKRELAEYRSKNEIAQKRFNRDLEDQKHVHEALQRDHELLKRNHQVLTEEWRQKHEALQRDHELLKHNHEALVDETKQISEKVGRLQDQFMSQIEEFGPKMSQFLLQQFADFRITLEQLHPLKRASE